MRSIKRKENEENRSEMKLKTTKRKKSKKISRYDEKEENRM